MSSPRTLPAFLRARIREEESAARDARRWFVSGAATPPDGTAGRSDARSAAESFAAFVLAHDPDRVLQECTAKRKIIDLLTGRSWTGSTVERDVVLRLLALPYAGHPDFREKWDESS